MSTAFDTLTGIFGSAFIPGNLITAGVTPLAGVTYSIEATAVRTTPGTGAAVIFALYDGNTFVTYMLGTDSGVFSLSLPRHTNVNGSYSIRAFATDPGSQWTLTIACNPLRGAFQS